MSSSSSSSIDDNARELFSVLVEQENHNLIPFSFIAEGGVEDSSIFTFEISGTSTPYFDYSLLINNNTVATTSDSQAYVPSDEPSLFEHRNTFHVDVISKDESGIKDYNVRMQKEVYGYENPSYVFNIPKFSWSNDIFGNLSEIEDEINEGSVWISDTDKNIHRVKYTSDDATITYSDTVASTLHTIVFEKGTSKSYLTGYDHLISCSIDDYLSNVTSSISSSIFVNKSIYNSNNDIASLPESANVWTVQTYSGDVLLRDAETLDIIETYSGFDAPYKVLWSEYHQYHFIVGTNILWKLEGGVKTSVYSIKGYDIVDAACSPDGHICLLFNGDNDDIIRILKPDLYGISISETISDKNVRYCTYCDQGIFYILVELVNSGDTYGFINYIYDSKKGILEAIEDAAVLSVTTTTTTPSIPTNKVEVKYPIGGEWLEVGSELEIKWASTESITDYVKIELYKGGVFSYLITSSTPNTGVYAWSSIPSSIVNGVDYKIKISWLGTTDLDQNKDMSANYFTISSVPQTTTTETTTTTINRSVGIGYNSGNRHIVNALRNGLIGFFDLDDKLFYGLFDTTTIDLTCMAVREADINQYSNVSSIRVFVGSDLYLSDKWDSGIIETDKNAIYYGGGDNLTPGQTYYVNIQVFDSRYGWSGVQTKEWTMPR